MDSERWRRMETLFSAARDLRASEREGFLERECGADSDLRTELLRLLDASEEVGDRFEQLVERAGAALGGEGAQGGERARPSVPERIGPFRISTLLGQGGMGDVYLGERVDGEFRQRVAIKLLREGRQGGSNRRRFLDERQILADLVHPNIARLLDGGTTDQGEPYLVMELVEGESIDAYCDRWRLEVDQRVRLVRRVCAAVDFAHRRRIVHRDLKPANLLVTVDGEPKLLDFGIAKLLEDEGAEPPTVTAVWQRALTPEYASPEQISGDRVTEATDIHALGLLLYRLLTGLSPWAGAAPTGGGLPRAVREHEPVPPSRALQALVAAAAHEVEEIAAARRATPGELVRQLAPDLDHVVAKALRKEPDDRYGTVAELSAELDRFLSGQPVAARRADRAYRWRQEWSRHRGVAAGVAAALLATVGYFGHGMWPQIGARDSSTGEAARPAAPVLSLQDPASEPGVHPRNPQAARLYAAGLAALRRFDALGARDQLSQALAADPELPLAHAALADAARELGFVKEARDEVSRALELAGNLPRAERLEVEARNHEMAGRWDQAIDAYRTLTTLFPEVPEAFLRLASVQIEAGRARQALATLDEMRRQISGIDADPRVALAEAEAAGALSDYERELGAARRAAGNARRREAPLLVARALLAQWWALRNLGRLEEAAPPAAEARQLFAAAGSRGGVALALNAQATLFADQGRLEEAIQADLEALETFRQLGDRRHMSWSLNNLGRNLRGRGDLSGARRMYEESLTLCRELEDGSCTARAEANLGRMHLESGELTTARELHEDSLRLRRGIGEKRGVAGAVVDLAVVQLAQGQLPEAEAGLHEAQRAFLELGDRQSAAHVDDFLGATLFERGDLEAARQARERALAVWQDLGPGAAARTRLALAELDLAGGRSAAASSALEALLKPDRQRELGGTAALAQALLANARLALGDESAARRALTEARKPSTRQLALADRLTLAIWTTRAEEILRLDGSHPLSEVAAEARAAGLRGSELEARLVAGELALRRDARVASQQLGELAQEAETAGYGRISARARALLASIGPG